MGDQELIDADLELVRKGGLLEFTRMAWPLVDPGRPFLDNWHLEAVCEHLQAVTAGEIQNLIISQPPGTTKSRLVSVMWPTWQWTLDPSFKWMFASYDHSLAIRDARSQLQIMKSSWWKERWVDRASLPATCAEGDFQNLQGGWRFSTFVNGPITGRHPDGKVVDDPIKAKGLTQLALEGVVEFWKSWSTRGADPAKTRNVVIMQRLHDEDLVGYLKRQGGFTELRLPMRYEAKKPCITNIGSWGGDPRTTDGELLMPSRFPEAVVSRLEKDLGPQAAAAQLQQNPVPDQGNIFQKEWFKRWKQAELPAKWENLIQSWDCAFKGTSSSDYVVGQVWGQSGPNYYLLDCVRKKMGFSETLEAIRALTQRWPEAMVKLVEDKANGPAVVETLSKELSGIVPVNPEGGKVARANAITGLYKAGNVFHPDPGSHIWVPDHEEELLRFPFGANDDSVDSGTQALLYLYKAQQAYWDVWEQANGAEFFRPT
jgi:predicted phage terminase large subunit-like protein